MQSAPPIAIRAGHHSVPMTIARSNRGASSTTSAEAGRLIRENLAGLPIDSLPLALCVAMGQSAERPTMVAPAEAVTVRARLAFFLPVRLDGDGCARFWATPQPTNGAAGFHALAGTRGRHAPVAAVSVRRLGGGRPGGPPARGATVDRHIGAR